VSRLSRHIRQSLVQPAGQIRLKLGAGKGAGSAAADKMR